MKRLTAKDWFSKTQLAAVRRLCETSFTRRHLYNRWLFLQNPARTFMVRTCLPATDKTYVRALQQDPCSYCGTTSHPRYRSPIVLVTLTARQRKRKQDLLNVTATCASCRNQKWNTPLLHFMLEQNRKTP